ncbi:MAG TPA: hypothetical protein VFE33_05635 [Thermoanaerobaculia bacterium]|nr:hypothetical protein [Thermoanaerobaculia bacterium]
MKKVVVALFLASFAAGLLAQEAPEAKLGAKPAVREYVYFPAKGVERTGDVDKLLAKATNISYHGGPVLTSAKVVFIFWGPSFANASSPDHTYATTLQSFRNQFGTNGEYNTITQYSGIQLANLGSGTADMFDTATPPTNVTDSAVRGEVNKYLTTHTFNNSTIYEVVIPSASHSSQGGGTSCGGSPLQYCAYHSHFTTSGHDAKYSIEPYPSCSGCKVSGWSDVQNQEHFVTHETREAVTDPDLNAWWNSSTGAEADDQCAWSPTPFLSGGFGYQYEWSNANGGCVQTR